MTDHQIIVRLVRTMNSIQKHVARGGTMHSIRGQELCDRYDSLRSMAQAGRIWRAYCEEIGADVSHAGHDFFA